MLFLHPTISNKKTLWPNPCPLPGQYCHALKHPPPAQIMCIILTNVLSGILMREQCDLLCNFDGL